jgi:hypothetical protein
MNIEQQRFYDTITNNDIIEFKKILIFQKFDPIFESNLLIRRATELGRFEIVKLLLEDRRVNPAVFESYIIRSAAEDQYFNLVDLFLKDKRIDPTCNGSQFPIVYSFENKNLEITKILWQDKRVRDTLKISDHNLFLEIHNFLLKEKINLF